PHRRQPAPGDVAPGSPWQEQEPHGPGPDAYTLQQSAGGDGRATREWRQVRVGAAGRCRPRGLDGRRGVVRICGTGSSPEGFASSYLGPREGAAAVCRPLGLQERHARDGEGPDSAGPARHYLDAEGESVDEQNDERGHRRVSATAISARR